VHYPIPVVLNFKEAYLVEFNLVVRIRYRQCLCYYMSAIL